MPFFNVHIFEFAGLEDLAALLALDKLRFLITAHNLHTWVLAGLHPGSTGGLGLRL